MTAASASESVDLTALGRHLDEAGVTRHGPLTADLIAGGRSNLTFRVSDGVSTWVLRRPPRHGLTPSAHDMVREYRVVAALAGTAVPVARAVTCGGADSALGVPFAMVDFVDGRVVRTAAQLRALGDSGAVGGCVDALVRALADLHAVDPGQVGLADFGRPAGYLARQVHRWGSQWDHVRLARDHRDGDVHRLRDALADATPAESAASLVHGDYRIDNTILDGHDPTRVRAILDWELSTLGDPLSDAALMCVYRDPALDLIIDTDAAWTSPLIPSADELAHRYSLAAQRPLVHWPFHMALAYFKLAVIAAGIDFRRRSSDGSPGVADRVGETVAPLVAAGLGALAAS